MLAPSKLNLFLEVTGKRSNGYHELHSLAVFLDLGDEVTIEASDKIECASAIDNNIILKAAHLLAKKYAIKQGAKINLHKNIPIGGGLGGGSADAAATLALLNNFWQIGADNKTLYELGLILGADVPACVYSILENKNSVIFRGIGEILEPAPKLPEMHFVLANPNQPLATAEVFKYFKYNGEVFKNFLPGEDLKTRRNDLEQVSTSLMPEIAKILKAIAADPTCRLARMSGSGATCFGLFNSLDNAETAAVNLAKLQPGWWVRAASLKD